MNGINRAILIGTLGKDPEIKSGRDGKLKISTLTIATGEKYKGKNGDWQTITDWHNVVVFNNKFVETLHKGDVVYVEGKMRHSSYNKQDGTKVYTVAILAQSINLISTKEKKQEVTNKEGQQEEEEQKDFTPTYEDRMIDVPDIDIPF